MQSRGRRPDSRRFCAGARSLRSDVDVTSSLRGVIDRARLDETGETFGLWSPQSSSSNDDSALAGGDAEEGRKMRGLGNDKALPTEFVPADREEAHATEDQTSLGKLVRA